MREVLKTNTLYCDVSVVSQAHRKLHVHPSQPSAPSGVQDERKHLKEINIHPEDVEIR